MKLPRSRAEASRLVELPEIGSTNSELVARAAAGNEPHFSVLVTANQTAGRGRLDRVWVSPPGTTIAVSVLLRPVLPGGEPLGLEHYGWLPLIAGVAMTRAVQRLIPAERVGLKWPNDVQIDGLKVAGLLAELLPGADAVVIGAGLNLTMTPEQLPTATSTSLTMEGVPVDGDALTDAVLSRYLSALRELYTEFVRVGGDPLASDIRTIVEAECSTIGQRIHVQLPGGNDLYGVATGIDGSGRLLVRSSADARVTAVAAGDVTHVRYE